MNSPSNKTGRLQRRVLAQRLALIRAAKDNVASPVQTRESRSRYVEASEDRFLWFAVEQEPERRFETALWAVFARR